MSLLTELDINYNFNDSISWGNKNKIKIKMYNWGHEDFLALRS